MRDMIRGFISENFLFNAGDRAFGDADSFIGEGIIDSMGIMELVDFIEKSFGIKVEDAELVPENLDSVEKIIGFVGKKTGATR